MLLMSCEIQSQTLTEQSSASFLFFLIYSPFETIHTQPTVHGMNYIYMYIYIGTELFYFNLLKVILKSFWDNSL